MTTLETQQQQLNQLFNFAKKIPIPFNQLLYELTDLSFNEKKFFAQYYQFIGTQTSGVVRKARSGAFVYLHYSINPNITPPIKIPPIPSNLKPAQQTIPSGSSVSANAQQFSNINYPISNIRDKPTNIKKNVKLRNYSNADVIVYKAIKYNSNWSKTLFPKINFNPNLKNAWELKGGVLGVSNNEVQFRVRVRYVTGVNLILTPSKYETINTGVSISDSIEDLIDECWMKLESWWNKMKTKDSIEVEIKQLDLVVIRNI